MFTNSKLDVAYNDALCIANYKLDSFKFRKGFEEDTIITSSEKEQIVSFLKAKMPKTSVDFRKLKSQVDKQEFLTTDYYANPYPKKFKGAYASVVYKTFAGIMLIYL